LVIGYWLLVIGHWLFMNKRKLTEEQVQEIKSSPFHYRELMEMYRVSRSCVSKIRRGERRKDFRGNLTDEQVQEIKVFPLIHRKDLAEKYGVSVSYIGKIRRMGYKRKLTDEQVQEIRDTTLLQYKDLAKIYGVSKSCISKIRANGDGQCLQV